MKGSLIFTTILLMVALFLSTAVLVAEAAIDSNLDRMRKALLEKQENIKSIQEGVQYQQVLLSGSSNFGNKENPISKSYNQEKEKQISELKELNKLLDYEVEFLKKNWEEGVVTALYRNLLDRDPDAGGFANWVKILKVNPVRQVIKAIASSEEYKNKNMNSPTETVKNAYRIFLGREVEPAVLAEQVKNVEKNGALAVTISLIDSEEYTKMIGDNSVPVPGAILKK